MAAGGSTVFQIIGLIVIIYSVSCTLAHSCGHRIPRPDEVIHGVPLSSDSDFSTRRKRSPDQPLRIHLVYEGSVSRLPAQEQNLVKNNLIPSAVSYWEETLKVHESPPEPIRLLRACNTNKVRYQTDETHPYCLDGCKATTMCGETEVPTEHLAACREVGNDGTLTVTGTAGLGVPSADFVLYVSAHNTERCDVGTTVAYAAYCQLEAQYDRPVAGYFNLCPSSISSLPHDTHQMQSTIKHEILHALGFSAGLYAFFRGPNGEPLTERNMSDGKPKEFNENLQVYQWSDRVVREIRRSDWAGSNGHTEKVLHMMVTPNVLRETRAHFNCPTLEGAELEDQGVIGTALTHWEKRVFENEAMTGTYTQNPMISRITLAFMEDTGWYSVDYNKAERLEWGRDLGCDFVQKSCYYWMNERDIKQGEQRTPHPFCTSARIGSHLHSECPTNRDAVVVCNLIKYNQPRPLRYQHFKWLEGVKKDEVPYFAGSVLLADYCPYLQELDWKKEEEVVRGSRCQLEQNNADPEINYNMEKYGADSLCFEHKTLWRITQCKSSHDVEHWGSGCYQFSCSSTEGLQIRVNGALYRCYHEGQILAIKTLTKDWLHEGTVICPSCAEICQARGIACPAESSPPALQTQDLIAPCNRAPHTVAIETVTKAAMFIVTMATALS